MLCNIHDKVTYRIIVEKRETKKQERITLALFKNLSHRKPIFKLFLNIFYCSSPLIINKSQIKIFWETVMTQWAQEDVSVDV
jgi:hypothetical protein